jgi:DNA polymerase III alpha subunit (gram-positive type)
MYTRRFWVDTETTGLKPDKNFAFQISYLIEEGGAILHSRTLEFRPDEYDNYEFNKKAEAVHGYSRDKIISLQSETEGFAALTSDLSHYGNERLTLTGYNINFDIGFLKAIFRRNKQASAFYKYFDYIHCDILQFVQACRVAGIINIDHINLENICHYFGINTETVHHSMTDILNTKSVFDKLTGMTGGGAVSVKIEA